MTLFPLPPVERDTRPRWMRDLSRVVRLMAEEAAELPKAPLPPPAPARLLIAQCGGKKLDRPAPVLDLYTGSLWHSIRKHAPGRAQVAVLSAKHGLMLHDPHHLVAPYDQRMTRQRAAELAGLGLYDGPERHTKRTGAHAGRRFGMSAGASLDWARSAARQDIEAVCLVGGELYASVGRAWIAKAQAAGILSGRCEITIIVDQTGYMKQRMNRWLHGERGANGGPALED